jgi:hypothetical protein
MKQLQWVWGALLGAFCFGCSGSDDGGGGAAIDQSITCAPKQLRIQGSINDIPVDISETATNYFFANKISADPGELNVTIPSGQFQLQFDELTPYGGSSAARGMLRQPAGEVGNCANDGFPGSMSISKDGNTTFFTLVQLTNMGECGGAAAKGQLQGCFATED